MCPLWPSAFLFGHLLWAARPYLARLPIGVARPFTGTVKCVSPPMVVRLGSTQLSGFEVRFLVSGPRGRGTPLLLRGFGLALRPLAARPVSYTHLTLPTMLMV